MWGTGQGEGDVMGRVLEGPEGQVRRILIWRYWGATDGQGRSVLIRTKRWEGS